MDSDLGNMRVPESLEDVRQVLVPKPTVTVVWDQDTEGCQLECKGFKSIEMAIAVLDMAKRELEDQRRLARVAAFQNQAAQAQQTAAIRRAIGDPRRPDTKH